MSPIEVEVSDKVGTLWLANESRGNVMDALFFEQLGETMRELEGDDEVRAVVLAARGPHFSFGLDLKGKTLEQMQKLLGGGLAAEREQLFRQIRQWQKAIDTLASCSKPVVAAVQGACIGAGLDLICACDIRYASDDAIVSLRETRMAIVADLGSLQRLGLLVGQGYLREMAFTGRDVSASEAAHQGLFNDVLPDAAAAQARARSTALQVASQSPLTVRGVKRMLDEMHRERIERGLQSVALWNAAFLPSEDLKEALSAFAEKRQARFEGK
jgi:enoyl-CoA hydratase